MKKTKNILTKIEENPVFRVIVIVVVLVSLIIWLQSFFAKPYVSINQIVIPAYSSDYQGGFSVINPTDKIYRNIVIKVGTTDNFIFEPNSFNIGPKADFRTSFTYEEIGRFDDNHIILYEENQFVYLKISTLRANDKLDYIINIKNEDKAKHTLSIKMERNKLIEDSEFQLYLPYLLENTGCNICNMERYTESLFNKGLRINYCFGGTSFPVSRDSASVVSSAFWIYPEWEMGEMNYIFDGIANNSKSRLSLYHHNNSLFVEIVESNGHKHTFSNLAKFKEWDKEYKGFNHVYFALDTQMRTFILYLNNIPLINYSFSELTFELPDYYNYGFNEMIDSGCGYCGNFIIDDIGVWSTQTLEAFDVNNIYIGNYSEE